jgi:HSP20 family protein
MGRRDFSPIDIFLQLESDMRRNAEGALRAVLFQPCVDMYETAEALVVKMELAGVRPEKLNISLSADDRLLTVSGERVESDQEHSERLRCYQLEIFFGAFEREIVLPGNLHFDRTKIAAHYRDGFLIISLPRRPEAETQTRTIEVTRG